MKCKICGTEQDPSHWTNENEMREHQMCFSCNFWRTMLEKDTKRPSHTWCMIDGTHYVIEPDDPKSHFQGFGGAKFHIRLKTDMKLQLVIFGVKANQKDIGEKNFLTMLTLIGDGRKLVNVII